MISATHELRVTFAVKDKALMQKRQKDNSMEFEFVQPESRETAVKLSLPTVF